MVRIKEEEEEEVITKEVIETEVEEAEEEVTINIIMENRMVGDKEEDNYLNMQNHLSIKQVYDEDDPISHSFFFFSISLAMKRPNPN